MSNPLRRDYRLQYHFYTVDACARLGAKAKLASAATVADLDGLRVRLRLFPQTSLVKRNG
jgi:hypothetical protein